MNRPLSLPLCFLVLAAALGGCAHPKAAKPVATPVEPPRKEAPLPKQAPLPSEIEIADLKEIPQDLAPLARAAGERLLLEPPCRSTLTNEFRARYFTPWTATRPIYDRGETVEFMRETARRTWYGENLRRVDRKVLREILDSCALDSYPSRFDLAVAVTPGHLRGLPTRLPLFEKERDYPFDMLEYPQLKVNEPLRVLHATRDGVWLFVETPYTNGWVESRDIALVDREFVQSWMERPLAVLVRDRVPVAPDGGPVKFHAKLGTLFPLVRADGDAFEVAVATAGQGKAKRSTARLPGGDAASFPLAFNAETVTAIGNQFLGQPYGWGEMYGLRDCSALIRDFFLPFGIWMPRTSADQIASMPRLVKLSGRTHREKEELIRGEGRPFLSLLYKKGHIGLYVGTDAEGRPLMLHAAWSVRVKRGEEEQELVVGKGAITTLEPGRELGLVEGTTLIDRISELGTVTARCLPARRR